jgi:hypothetical protein
LGLTFGRGLGENKLFTSMASVGVRKVEADNGRMISALEWVIVLVLGAAAISALALLAVTVVGKLRR